MDFKIGVLVTTISQQAHSQLTVTIDDHRSMGQQTKLQNLMLVPFEKNDANNSTIYTCSYNFNSDILLSNLIPSGVGIRLAAIHGPTGS